ncbi:MAG: hypothetical protein J1E06_10755 [Acutalibacter sp.]|nr:hypothetical protein [Acutalibacter sp.]
MSQQKRIRRSMLFQIACLGLAAVLLAASLGGCMTYTPLRLAQLKEFERKVRSKYPLSIVECKYARGVWVDINVTKSGFDEESAYIILGYLTEIVRDEEFIEDFLAFHEEQGKKHPKEAGLWYPPHLYLNLMEWGETSYSYRFTAYPYEENYNSARPKDSYTWEGYAKWYGTIISKDGPLYDVELSPEKVEEAIKRYAE